jgi:competence protein ComEC
MLPQLASGFALGIYLASLGVSPAWVLCFAPLVVIRRDWCFLPLGILCGAAMLSLHQIKSLSPLAQFVEDGPKEVLLEGEVIAGPSPAFAADGTERRKLDIHVTQIGPPPGKSGEWLQLSGGVRCTLDEAPSGLAIGDYVRVWMSASPLPSPQNPHEVDHRERMYAHGIDAVGYCRGVLSIGENRSGGIDAIRVMVARSIEKNLSKEARAVIGALILGEPGALPPELRARFAATGTAHLLAVSGGHVVIVAMLIEMLLRLFWLRSAYLARRFSPPRGIAFVSLFFVIAYVYFVGASPSALRAGLAMGALLLCKSLGRTVSGATLVSLSALFALSIEPYELFGPSLQLSFAAVIGLGLFTPGLKRIFLRTPAKTEDTANKKEETPTPTVSAPSEPINSTRPRKASHLAQTLISSLYATTALQRFVRWLFRSLRDLLIATTAATLATTPIVAWHFSQVAPASLLANLAMVPLVSFILLPLGLLGAFSAVIQFDALTSYCFGISSQLWSWLEALLYLVSPERPTTLPLSALAVLLCYALLLVLFFLWGWMRPILAIAVTALLYVSYITPLQNDVLRVTFFSIGQGDSILIETPDDKVFLIDGGGAAAGHDDPGARAIMPMLRWRGIESLDLMALSHPHPDHFGGLASVAEEVEIKQFWHNGGYAPDPRFGRLLAATKEVAITPKDGETPYQSFIEEWGEVQIEMLGPVYQNVARPHEDENDNSLVFRLKYKERSILFTGDAESIAEESMIASGKSLRADVLKLGHHGSRSSTTDAFLDAVDPESVVICLGKKNKYGFPHREVAERLVERQLPTWRTDAGAVILETDGKEIHIRQNTPRTFYGELWPL